MALKPQESGSEIGYTIFQRVSFSPVRSVYPCNNSVTLTNKHKGPHKSDSWRFISPEGAAPSIITSRKYKNFFGGSKFSMAAQCSE